MRIFIKIFTIIILLSGCDTSSKKEWTQFRGNLENTGYTKSKAPTELTYLRWKFETESWVDSSPAVADGVVYFGSSDRHLYAVNINTGQEKWKFKTEGEVFSSPAVADGVVYFGSYDGYLYALE